MANSKRAKAKTFRGGFRFERPDQLVAKWGSYLPFPIKLVVTAVALLLFFVFMWFFGSLVGPALIFLPIIYFAWNTGDRITAGEARWALSAASVGAYYMIGKLFLTGSFFLLIIGVLVLLWIPAYFQNRGRGGGLKETISLQGGFRFHQGNTLRDVRQNRRRTMTKLLVFCLLIVFFTPTASARFDSDYGGCGNTICRGMTGVAHITTNALTSDTSTSSTSFAASQGSGAAASPPASSSPAATTTSSTASNPPSCGSNLFCDFAVSWGSAGSSINHLTGNAGPNFVHFMATGCPGGQSWVSSGKQAGALPSAGDGTCQYTAPADNLVHANDGVVTDPSGPGAALTQPQPPSAPPVQAAQVFASTFKQILFSFTGSSSPKDARLGSTMSFHFSSSRTPVNLAGTVTNDCGTRPMQMSFAPDSNGVSGTVTANYVVDCMGNMKYHVTMTAIPEVDQKSTSGLFGYLPSLLNAAKAATVSQDGVFFLAPHKPHLSVTVLDKQPVDGAGALLAGTGTLTLQLTTDDADSSDASQVIQGFLATASGGWTGKIAVSGNPTVYVMPVDWEEGKSYSFNVQSVSKFKDGTGDFIMSDPQTVSAVVGEAPKSHVLNVIGVHFTPNTLAPGVNTVGGADVKCDGDGFAGGTVFWGDGTSAVVPPQACPAAGGSVSLGNHAFIAGEWHPCVNLAMLDGNHKPLTGWVSDCSDNPATVLVKTSTGVLPPDTSPANGGGGSTDGSGTGTPAPGNTGQPAGTSVPNGTSATDKTTTDVKNTVNSLTTQSEDVVFTMTHGYLGMFLLVGVVLVVGVGAFWFARQKGMLRKWGFEPTVKAPTSFDGKKPGFLKRLFSKAPKGLQPTMPDVKSLTPNININVADADEDSDADFDSLDASDDVDADFGGTMRRPRKAKKKVGKRKR